MAFCCAHTAVADILIEGESGALFDGNRYLLTSSNGAIQVSRGALGETRIGWQRAVGETTPALPNFDAVFYGPHGAPLQIGSYSNVTRSLPPGNVSAGMSVGGGSSGCNQLSGSFEVLDVAYAADGTPLRLALDVVHYCENWPRADRLRIRYNTAVPLTPSGVSANAGADVRATPGSTVMLDASASQSTFGGALAYTWSQLSGPPASLDNIHLAQPHVSLPSILGEYAFAKFAVTVRDSQGNEDVDEVTVIVSSLAPRSQVSIYSPATSPFGLLDIKSDLDLTQLTLKRNAGNGIDLSYTGAFTGYPYRPRLSMHWAAPRLGELREGEYGIAYRYPFQPRSKSGLDFSFGLGCDRSVGYFNVLEVAYDDLGRIERLAIDLAHSCTDDFSAAQLTASSIRYNSVVPLVSQMPHASAGENLEVLAGQTVELSGFMSSGGATGIAEYHWRQIAGPPITLPSANTETTTFVAPSVPLGGTSFVFELAVRNAAGYEDTDVVSVLVLSPQDRRTWMQLEQFASEGCSLLFHTCNGVNITLTRNEGDLELSSRDNGDNREWMTVAYQDSRPISVTMISEPGRAWEPGRVYLDLDRGSVGAASLNIAVDGLTCSHPRSTLTVHELERDAQNHPISLAADFTIACDGGPPIHGVIRVNSALPKTPSRPIASAGYDQQVVIGDVVRLTSASSFAGAGVASYEWAQISGTPVSLQSRGADAFFTTPALAGPHVFRLTIHGADGSVHSDDVVIDIPPAGTRRSRVLMESASMSALGFGRRHEMAIDSLIRASNANSFWINQSWSSFPASMFNLTVHAPFDQPLGVTSYAGSRGVNQPSRMAHDIANAPGLKFEWELYGCLDTRGRLVVHEYVLDQNGKAERIAVDVIQSCGLEGALTRAAIRMNSAIPLRAAGPSISAGPDRVSRGGRNVVLDGRYSISWLDESLTYAWVQVAGPVVQLSSSTIARPVFVAPTVAQDVSLRFELTVTDESGRSATDAVNVLVLAPTTPSHDVRLQLDSRNTQIFKAHSKPTPMDVIGRNLLEHTADDSYLRVQHDESRLHLAYLGDVGVYFSFDSRAMRDGRLRPGTWTLSGSADEPMMDVGFDGLDGMQCASASVPKTIDISEVEYDGSGRVTRLAFGYRLDCEDLVLTGVGHFNSAAAASVPDHLASSPPTQPPTQPPPASSTNGASSSKGGGGAFDGLLLSGLMLLLGGLRRARNRASDMRG